MTSLIINQLYECNNGLKAAIQDVLCGLKITLTSIIINEFYEYNNGLKATIQKVLGVLPVDMGGVSTFEVSNCIISE